MNTHTPAALQHAIDRLATQAKGQHTPALSWAIATTNGITVAGATGHADVPQRRPPTTHDQYPWFSMTKIATATAAARLAHRDQLDLDAPIGTYLPRTLDNTQARLTTRQLLTHTAGLPNPLPIRWIRPAGQPPDLELIATIVGKHRRPRREPGGRAAYSNIGYLLAGQVLEAASGTSIEALVTHQVLRPLRMEHTGYTYDPGRPHATGHIRAPRVVDPLLGLLLPNRTLGERADGYRTLRPFLVQGAAYGGLVGTPTDAAKLALAHLQPDGPLGDLRAMRHITHRGKPFDHGTGWFRKPADAQRIPAFVEHYGTGGGFWNAMRIYPTLGTAIVAMTNNTTTWPFDHFFDAAARAVNAASQHAAR